jgi:hypothetical protein
VEAAINEALFFQRIDDDAVENFWCFNPRDRDAQDELGVVTYQHDETFGLPKLLGTPNARHFRDFSTHIRGVHRAGVAVVAHHGPPAASPGAGLAREVALAAIENPGTVTLPSSSD